MSMTRDELLLLSLMTELINPIDALQFCDDPDFPLDEGDRANALAIRTLICEHTRGYFSDSTVDDLVCFAIDHAPLTMNANPDARFTPTQTLTMTFPQANAIAYNFSLN